MTDLLSLYTGNDYIKELVKQIVKSPAASIHIKGLAGSLPAVVGSSLYKLANCTQLFILPDKEAAAYFYTDLQSLLADQPILLYPAIEHQLDMNLALAATPNLIRNQILQQLSQDRNAPHLIVTYPEAIAIQVIGYHSLTQNTWVIQQEEKIVLIELVDQLIKKGFEKVDFVYEAGEFAIRGGIIDIFSYANQLPYRIELFGKEIESIRTFNPANQLSIADVEKAIIFSNKPHSNQNTTYQSFLEFLPANTCIWFEDYGLILDIIKTQAEQEQLRTKELHTQQEQLRTKELHTQQEQLRTKELHKQQGQLRTKELHTQQEQLPTKELHTQQEQLRTKELHTQQGHLRTKELPIQNSGKEPKESLKHSEIAYEEPEAWRENTQNFTCIEFGSRFYLKPKEVVEYKASPQPDFNQQFKLLADNLYENHQLGLRNMLLSESPAQLDRLSNVLAELEISLKYDILPIGLSQGFIDHRVGIACYTDHQIFGRYYRYKTPQQYTKSQAFTLKELNNLQKGDYVVHIDYGIARFAGLSKVHVNDKEQEVLRLIYKDNDVVYLSLHALHKLSKYTGKEGFVPTMSKLGSVAWEQKKKRVKHKVQDIAKELIGLYGKRKHAPGFAFSTDNFLQAELESSFMYEDTPDQAAANADVKKDMEAPHPMDRLVCGDVGFGKTEVAIRAAFKAVQDLKQVAVLVPTTILALQHYESFKSRLEKFPVKIQYVNRFKSQHETNQIRHDVAQGKIDILIGTHTILSKSFNFHDLGLLVIDEEQKFGVKAKDRIKELKINVDVLTLTATPIPRTLHFSLMGARDLSVIATPPPNRQPVRTSIHTFDKKVVQEAIHYEVQRGGQVFFVHNRVSNIEEVANMIHKLVPEYRIGIAHGQMGGDQLEKRMLTFIAGGYDILVSTNIVESGLDIPNANTMIINDSHMFGLSDLHQLRGRVGRSNKQAFCYLIAPPSASLTSEARKRLSTLEEFTELGDGFKVAMRDLDIRGAGNLLGAEQSGFIADVGFEAYCKILDEAVQELKENEFKELFAEELLRKDQLSSIDCTLETDLELLIPSTYINNDTERLRLYTKLDSASDHIELADFQRELVDRFGPLPVPVQELIKAVKLRWTAKELGLQKIKLKDDMMRCYFNPPAQKATFTEKLSRILSYVQQNPYRCQLKELKNQLMLTVNNVPSVEEAQQVLEAIA